MTKAAHSSSVSPRLVVEASLTLVLVTFVALWFVPVDWGESESVYTDSSGHTVTEHSVSRHPPIVVDDGVRIGVVVTAAVCALLLWRGHHPSTVVLAVLAAMAYVLSFLGIMTIGILVFPFATLLMVAAVASHLQGRRASTVAGQPDRPRK